MESSQLARRIIQHNHQHNRRRRRERKSADQSIEAIISSTIRPCTIDSNLLSPDPFYYYDISSESESESEYHPPINRQESIIARGDAGAMPDIKEWQWVCCDCGKYNSLPPGHQYITGNEVCADKNCGHTPCDQCQSVETVVWRGPQKVACQAEKKGRCYRKT